MEVTALFGRFVWRGVNIDDVTFHPSRGSRIKPTLKVCEHNWVAHASNAPSECAQMHSTTRPFAQWNLILAHLQHSKTLEKHENKDKLF